MTPPTVDQLRNLADRASRGTLTAAEVARLREGIDRLAKFEAAYREYRARLDAEHAKIARNASAANRPETRLALDGMAAGLHTATAHAVTCFEGSDASRTYLDDEPADDTGPPEMVHVGSYCWQCDHTTTEACHPCAVPVHVTADRADTERARIQQQAHDDGPTVDECAEADDAHWNAKYAGEGA